MQQFARWLPSFSTLLIIAGVVCMGAGLWTAFQYRPRPLTATEQAALSEGERISRVTTDASAPSLLPAPGVASLDVRGEISSLDDKTASPPSKPDQAPPAQAPVPTPVPTATPIPTVVPLPTSIPARQPPTRIKAPTIGVDSKIVEVGWKSVQQGNQWFSEWGTADYAVGFHKTAAYLGHVGNTVLSGHNNVKGEVFRNLVDLNIGDPVSVWADDREYQYRVTDKFIVRETDAPLEQRLANARWIAASEDERITLVSCWPYWTNTHRVIVVARPVAVADMMVNQLRVTPPDVPTAGADCPARPAPGAIANAWQDNDDLRKRLGCAVDKAATVQTTQQFFKGGRMVWRPDTASIALLYDTGRWQTVTSFNGLTATEVPPETANCAVEPKLGFGRVWTGLPGARQQLGCATSDEVGVAASVQMFEGGTALLFANSATPVLLFRDGSWAVSKP